MALAGKKRAQDTAVVDGLAAAMLNPDFYPRRPADVAHVETHISHVFLAGNLVYKIKKPVRFSFLDYSTLAKRRHFLEEELRLNRRLAPSVYLEILPISHGDSGWRLDGGGDPVEYALVMRRLPEERMLDKLLERGEVTAPMMRALAEILIPFHAEARTGEEIRRRGDPGVIRKVWEENLADIRPFVGKLLDNRSFEAVGNFGRRFIAERSELMLRRAGEGRVRELHGDLHCEHVCFAPERIQIYDCVEFSADLRCCDVASEIAFLLMDLEFRGAKDLGREFLRRYLELSRDRELPQLLSFYKCHRALVRGKVHALQSRESSGTARRYFDLAYSYTWDEFKPFLILVCGLTGSGKSTLAKALGRRLGLPVVSSDVTRKALAGVSNRHDLASYGTGIYTRGMTEKTYGAMAGQAEKHIDDGEGAILDGTFLKKAQREAVLGLAAKRGVPALVIWCRSSDKLARERLLKRAEEGKDISDGRWEIYAAQKQAVEPVVELRPESYFTLDTEASLEELCGKAEEFLSSALKKRRSL
jgi:aminoglycoside phosphotransferase family enzyme/predicted kinase